MEKKKLNVLLVDDEDMLRKSFAAYFEEDDYQVFQAEGGDSALEIIKGNSIDFVVSDVRMSKGDGLALLKNIQALPRPIPTVVLITGFAELNREEALKSGALELFEKPLNFDKVIALIEATCRFRP